MNSDLEPRGTMESLAKIPFLLIVPYAYKILSTSPNPTARKEEIVYTTVDWIAGRNIAIKLFQIGWALASTIEIATILALQFPSPSLLSQTILSFFTFEGGDPSRIQLSSLSLLGAVLLILAAMIRLQTYKELGRFFVFEISIQKDHRLITTGPYQYVRHPSYTAVVMADIGWLLWTLSKGSWLMESGFWDTRYGPAVFCFYLSLIAVGPAVTLTRMTDEDLALKKKFGRKWEEWAEKVPYRLIPGIY